MSVFKKFVEVGRVALINKGARTGSLVVIVDIADQNRALVAATKGNYRSLFPIRRLELTPITVTIPRGAKNPDVAKAFKEEKAQEKWDATNWAKRLKAQKKRNSLNDFGRFKLMVYRRRRSYHIGGLVGQIRKPARDAKKAAAAKAKAKAAAKTKATKATKAAAQ